MDVASATSAKTPSSATSLSALTDQYDQFLTLLTTQLQNQDPLDPMDNKDMVNQLVQFSGVEQQIKQNENLESLIGLLNSSADAAALQYIGKDVQVEGDITHYDGEHDVTFGYTPPKDTKELTVKIYNTEGKVVRDFEGSTSNQRHTVTWDGKDANGDPVEPGLYYFAIAAEDSDGETVHGKVDISGRVTGTGTSDSGPTLRIGDAEYSLSEVMSVHAANDA